MVNYSTFQSLGLLYDVISNSVFERAFFMSKRLAIKWREHGALQQGKGVSCWRGGGGGVVVRFNLTKAPFLP